MITFTEAQVSAWYGAIFWPLVRMLALFMTAPVFSHRAVPMRAKVGLGVLIVIVVLPATPPMPLGDVLSGQGVMLLFNNILIGALIGFTVRLVFASLEMAGEMIGLQMGLSYAGFFNPSAGQTENSVSTFMALLAILMFVSIDGHLMLIHALAESFVQFPIGDTFAVPSTFERAARMGSDLFQTSLSIALPFIAIMLLVNVVLGVLARVAPQLNIFAVGFPMTMLVGFLVLFTALPYIEAPIRAALERSIGLWVH